MKREKMKKNNNERLGRFARVLAILTIYSFALYYFLEYWYAVYAIGAIALYMYAIATAERDPNDRCDCVSCQRYFQDNELSDLLSEGITENGE